ncbi:MAG TPA: response regulator [Gemmatimonadaceae bacterium]|nr:response regulator [Gemmatimonadaceae bacterium]
MPPRPIASEEWVGIVDDDESIRRSLVRLLRVLGIRAETFGTADEYLEQVLSPPRCLLIDVQLGTSTGFEFFDRLAARDGVVPPTIFISAYDDPATLQRAWASGARGWLRKPFSAAALLELIEPYFSSRQSDSSNERADVSAYSTTAVAGRDC